MQPTPIRSLFAHNITETAERRALTLGLDGRQHFLAHELDGSEHLNPKPSAERHLLHSHERELTTYQVRDLGAGLSV